jgi:hypothetical protein
MGSTTPNNILTHTNITATAPRPLDAKIVVGNNQEFTTKNSISTSYRYIGMKVFDQNDNIEYQLVTTPISGNSTGYSDAGNLNNEPTSWKNISFGATPLIYNQVGIWLNESSTHMQLNTDVQYTFTATTFGHVKKIQWEFVKGGSSITYNKETITHTFISAGQHTIKLHVWDRFDNQLTYINSATATAIGLLSIYEFKVNPYAGIKAYDGAASGRTYDFTITTTEDINEPFLENISINYSDVVVVLAENGALSTGVTYQSGNVLFVNGSQINDLKNKVFDEDVNFTLNFKIYSQTALEDEATYHSIDKIAVGSDTFTYNKTTKILSGFVTLLTPYDGTFCAVAGTLNIQGTNYNLIGSNNDTFTLPSTSIELAPDIYIITITLTQTVATGKGNETFTIQHTCSLEVEDDLYEVTFNVKDDHEIPIHLSGIGGIIAGTTLVGGNSPFTRNIANGSYSYSLTKPSFSSPSSGFVVSDAPLEINVEMSPNRSIDGFGITGVEAGDWATVTYNILPTRSTGEYEDSAYIVYKILDSSDIVCDTITQHKSDASPNYKSYYIHPDYNLHKLEVTVMSTYNLTDEISDSVTVDIGVAVPYWGIVTDAGMNYSDTVGNFISAYFNDDMFTETELFVSDLNIPVMTWYEEWINTRGHFWVAFPSDYPEYTEESLISLTSWVSIEERFEVTDYILGSETYKLYIYRGGLPSNSGYIGNDTLPLDQKFKH